ncbi:unnamed protein product [Lactuca virosa]|uniref:Cytochrome c assembly protein domain-containing protein n=1 Tax=Lactuca virosa TaxID=75947 RepID=A0AAU9N9A1_9ASTR|nr:unnamed protein product [Lactuca virosa]
MSSPISVSPSYVVDSLVVDSLAIDPFISDSLGCNPFLISLKSGILPGSWWAHHELGRGGWWFRDPEENASFMPRVLDTARIHSLILPLIHYWTSFLNIVALPCSVSRTSSVRSGLLAPVHNFASDDTRGIFLWWFFLLKTDISMIIFSQMKQRDSVRRTYKKEMVVARSTLVHLRHSAHAQPSPVML